MNQKDHGQSREDLDDDDGALFAAVKPLASKRQKKGLSASDLLKPSFGQKEQSYISTKFCAGTSKEGQVGGKDDNEEDRLVGLISAKDRELLSLAEKN